MEIISDDEKSHKRSSLLLHETKPFSLFDGKEGQTL
jgi:hypothetical protein